VAPNVRHTPPDRASVDHLDAIHCKLLRECLTLTQGHRADLYRRGLTRVEIERIGFASTPTPEEGDQIARALADYDLRGVPGFYREGDQWRMTKCRSGFFVPYRNPKGQIAALQYRLDVPFDKTKYLWLSSATRPGGTSPGAPVHFANRHLMRAAEEVLVTEGGLKADVIACLARTGVIGVAGVSCFGADFAARLREDFPKVRRVVIAYDMDLIVKDEVFAALQRLTRQLEQAAYQVRVRTWPAQYKGFDDYLLSQLAGQEVAA